MQSGCLSTSLEIGPPGSLWARFGKPNSLPQSLSSFSRLPANLAEHRGPREAAELLHEMAIEWTAGER
jgi:hypothetical protein